MGGGRGQQQVGPPQGKPAAGWYAAKENASGFDVDFTGWSGLDQQAMLRELSVFLRDAPTSFGHFNAFRPEETDRNCLVGWPELQLRVAKHRPPILQLLKRFDLRYEEQLRVIVCDGPSMLAWVGGYFHEPPGDRERALLGALVAPIGRRLRFRRALTENSSLRAALDEALEAIAGEAFVVHTSGAPLHMNAAAQARFDRSPSAAHAELRDAITHHLRGKKGTTHSSATHTVREVQMKGGPRRWLVVNRAGSAVEASSDLAKRFALTPREREVARFLLAGASNARIGAELSISDRTVEVHVRAILQKAGVSSRAALVASTIGFSL